MRRALHETALALSETHALLDVFLSRYGEFVALRPSCEPARPGG